jgi:hypothetical protein
MNAESFIAPPGELAIDDVHDEQHEIEPTCEEMGEALERLTKALAQTESGWSVAMHEAGAFAGRVLTCETLEQAKNEARAYLGIKPQF